MPIKAIIFDFDGLILETESPVHQSWQELFQEYGLSLSMDVWANVIGAGEGTFDPLGEFERQLGKPVQRDLLAQRRRQREDELVKVQKVMPGVQNYLQDAQRMGLKIGLASSSSCNWVVGHLTRLGLLDYFQAIRGSDDVTLAKPDPDLYLAVLDELAVNSRQAFALEDSPNGVMAARSAGIFCVAVPNQMTRDLPLDHADMILASLAELPLGQLVIEIEQRILEKENAENSLTN